MKEHHQPNQLLTAKEVAEMLAVRVKRVYELDIPFVQLSARSIRWRSVDVLAWIERRMTNANKNGRAA